MNGFLEGRGGAGEPSGSTAGTFWPWKAAKAAGVRAIASAGGGRPVTFARSVRIQRNMVKIPRIEPKVLRRLPNCSATEIIAIPELASGFHINIRCSVDLPKKEE